MRRYVRAGMSSSQWTAIVEETGRRVAVQVPDVCSGQVIDALTGAYRAGRDDVTAEMVQVPGPPMLIDEWTSADLETILRTAGELWQEYGEAIDRNDILSEQQKQLLAKASEAWSADQEITGLLAYAASQPADNFVYLLRCGHEVDLAEELVPVPGRVISLVCSVHGMQQVSLAPDCDGRPLFPGDQVVIADPPLVLQTPRTDGWWHVAHFDLVSGNSEIQVFLTRPGPASRLVAARNVRHTWKETGRG